MADEATLLLLGLPWEVAAAELRLAVCPRLPAACSLLSLFLPLDHKARPSGSALLTLRLSCPPSLAVAALSGVELGGRRADARLASPAEITRLHAQTQRALSRTSPLAPQTFLVPACPSLPPLPRSPSRDFVVLCHDTPRHVACGSFDLSDLPCGRVDLMARCIASALFISHAVRKEARVHLLLCEWSRTISCEGSSVRGLRPDERTIAAAIRRVLRDSPELPQQSHADEEAEAEGSGHKAEGQSSRVGQELTHQGQELTREEHELTQGEQKLTQQGQELTQHYHELTQGRQDSKPEAEGETRAAGEGKGWGETQRKEKREKKLKAKGDARPPGSGGLPGWRVVDGVCASLEGRLAALYATTREGEVGIGRGSRLVMLHEQGDRLESVIDRSGLTDTREEPQVQDGMAGMRLESQVSTVFVLGDGVGFLKSEEEVLQNYGAKPASVGRVPLLTSQCIVICNNVVDNLES